MEEAPKIDQKQLEQTTTEVTDLLRQAAQNKYTNVLKTVADNQRLQLEAQEAEIFNNLVVKGQEERARVPESIFKESFLPFFAGQQSLQNAGNVIGTWIGIVGAPMAEAVVIDGAGNELFTVPPVLDSSAIDITRKQLRSFSEVSEMSELKESHIKNQGVRYFLEQTGEMERTLIKPNSETISNNARRWQEIYARYGVGVPQNVSKDKKETANHDDFSYDEFDI
jgi:hypothetical protein